MKNLHGISQIILFIVFSFTFVIAIGTFEEAQRVDKAKNQTNEIAAQSIDIPDIIAVETYSSCLAIVSKN